MRVLTDYEVDLVTGGTINGSEITVTAPWSWERYIDFFSLLAITMGNGGGDRDPNDEPRQNRDEFDEPPCDKGNAIEGLTPPDEAKYYVPESVNAAYLVDALNYLKDYANTHMQTDVLSEFKAMYTNPNHPHFLDFKDWGTPNGPAGSQGGATTTYYSPAAGHEVTGSVYEAFGNWFYGFAGTWAGIPQEILWGAAALLQEGNNAFPWSDAAEDQPHVAAGIAAAQAYPGTQVTVFTVTEGHCGASSSRAVGSANLTGPASYQAIATDPNAMADLWNVLQNDYARLWQ